MTNLELLNSLNLQHDRFEKPFHFQGFDMHTNGRLLVALPSGNDSSIKACSGHKAQLIDEIINTRESNKKLPKLITIDTFKGKWFAVKIGDRYFLWELIRTIAALAKKLGEQSVEFLEDEREFESSLFKFNCGAWAVLLPCIENKVLIESTSILYIL